MAQLCQSLVPWLFVLRRLALLRTQQLCHASHFVLCHRRSRTDLPVAEIIHSQMNSL
jgi:hypothetical protein